jgi:hypothetical protein
MINILSNLQDRCKGIKSEKVDIMSIYDGDLSIIEIKDDESRINTTKDGLTEWLHNQSKFNLTKIISNTQVGNKTLFRLNDH